MWIDLFFQQFCAMLLKRILYTLRNKVLTLSQILLPLVFTALTIGILKTVPRENGIARKVPLNVGLYGETQVRILSRHHFSQTIDINTCIC